MHLCINMATVVLSSRWVTLLCWQCEVSKLSSVVSSCPEGLSPAGAASHWDDEGLPQTPHQGGTWLRHQGPDKGPGGWWTLLSVNTTQASPNVFLLSMIVVLCCCCCSECLYFGRYWMNQSSVLWLNKPKQVRFDKIHTTVEYWIIHSHFSVRFHKHLSILQVTSSFH